VTSAKSSLKIGTATYDRSATSFSTTMTSSDGMKGIVVYACYGGTLNGVKYQNNRLFMTTGRPNRNPARSSSCRTTTSKCTSPQVRRHEHISSPTSTRMRYGTRSTTLRQPIRHRDNEQRHAERDAPKSSGVYLFSLDSSDPHLTINGSGPEYRLAGTSVVLVGDIEWSVRMVQLGEHITQSSGSVPFLTILNL